MIEFREVPVPDEPDDRARPAEDASLPVGYGTSDVADLVDPSCPELPGCVLDPPANLQGEATDLGGKAADDDEPMDSDDDALPGVIAVSSRYRDEVVAEDFGGGGAAK